MGTGPGQTEMLAKWVDIRDVHFNLENRLKWSIPIFCDQFWLNALEMLAKSVSQCAESASLTSHDSMSILVWKNISMTDHGEFRPAQWFYVSALAVYIRSNTNAWHEPAILSPFWLIAYFISFKNDVLNTKCLTRYSDVWLVRLNFKS